jgi:hypothetical protein
MVYKCFDYKKNKKSEKKEIAGEKCTKNPTIPPKTQTSDTMI